MIRISAVSYLNTFPFVYGLKNFPSLPEFKLSLDVPSECARKLIESEADIALVPTGVIPLIPGAKLISGFCIGAKGPVTTVLLLSKVPVGQIKSIHLDVDSRTSVELVRILAREYWKISPDWIPINKNERELYQHFESVVAIGDKTFQLKKHFTYVYDLAEVWSLLTRLPMVFAVWATLSEIPGPFLEKFNDALNFGLQHKAASLDYFRHQVPDCGDCLRYLEKDISYDLDEEKKAGMELFLKYLRKY
jgi:chorismate dehydratase